MTAVSLPASTILAPVGTMQANLPLTSATQLTVPGGANYATVTVEVASIRYTTDGATTPTASIGTLVVNGQSFSLSGSAVLKNFQAIQVSTGAVITVDYYKF